MEELITSCELLDSALGRYYNACIALEQEAYHNFAQADLHSGFLKNLDDQLNDSASHKKKIGRCEMALRRVRNHSPTIVPINALPPELLTHIFGMVPPCCFESPEPTKIMAPMYPDTLAQVCSRWRRVAIGFCALWTHIDLSPSSDKSLSQRLLSRGKAFASRSEKLLLDIHIGGGSDSSGDSLARFCTAVATRARSLEAFNPYASTDRFKRIYNPIFNACFAHCVPGTLDHLTIRGDFGQYDSTWSPGTDDHLECFTTQTGVEQVRLDKLLLGVQVLHLEINCIPPTSRAYQGLVELRLMGSKMRLTETHFLGILAASPKLRIMYLDISVKNASQSPPRVQLNELEVLFLSWDDDRSNLLRLLCPGAQPLKLILEDRNRLSMSWSTATEFIKLFERSIVTELYVDQVVGTPGCGEVLSNPFQLLELTPHLKILALYGVAIKRPSGRLSRRLINKPSTPSAGSLLRLDTLHLVGARIYWASCLDLFQIYHIQRVTIWDCTVYGETSDSRIRDQGLVRRILADICPTVQILDSSVLKLAGVRDEDETWM